MAKGANFKFGMRPDKKSPEMTPEKNSQKGAGLWSCDS